MPIAYIGIDDTDNDASRGTGHLARTIAEQVSAKCPVLGVVRHQLFYDPRVPYTAHNSSASILIEITEKENLAALFEQVKGIILADFQAGSDPGLCMAIDIPQAVSEFGRKAKTDLVTQAEAHSLAKQYGILLEGLGGTQDGVIGALASIGLSSTGSDGRYVMIGAMRDLQGEQPVKAILKAGIDDIQTINGDSINNGIVLADKLRPSRREYKAILFVESHPDGLWHPLTLQ
jgi:tRNA(Ile2) C34 agmatinyltransferase TiaS